MARCALSESIAAGVFSLTGTVVRTADPASSAHEGAGATAPITGYCAKLFGGENKRMIIAIALQRKNAEFNFLEADIG